MMNREKLEDICDGRIPDGWTLPEHANLIQYENNVIRADFTTQEAPTPMVVTLKILSQMTDNQSLEATYPRMPVHLLPHLLEDGWFWETMEETSGYVRLKIQHRAPKP